MEFTLPGWGYFERMMARAEGVKDDVYTCTAGKRTIGVGHNLDAEGLCEAAILAQTKHDIAKARHVAIDFAGDTWAGMNPVRRDALTEMAFQLGAGSLAGFKKMRKATRAGQWKAVAKHALDSKWARDDTPERAARVAAILASGEPDSDN